MNTDGVQSAHIRCNSRRDAYTAMDTTPNTSKMANQKTLFCVDLTMEKPRFSRVWKLKRHMIQSDSPLLEFHTTETITYNFCIRLMLISCPFSLKILSSSALVWSATWPGFVEGSRRGSLSTIMSKSMSFSFNPLPSFVKQNAYSPGAFAVRT